MNIYGYYTPFLCIFIFLFKKGRKEGKSQAEGSRGVRPKKQEKSICKRKTHRKCSFPIEALIAQGRISLRFSLDLGDRLILGLCYGNRLGYKDLLTLASKNGEPVEEEPSGAKSHCRQNRKDE